MKEEADMAGDAQTEGGFIRTRARFWRGWVRFCVWALVAGSMAYGQPDTLWTRQYVYPPIFLPSDVLWDTQGNILVSGNIQGPTSLDMFILKLDGNGDYISLMQYGPQNADEEAGAFLRRAVGGGYALAGNTRQNRDDFYLVRLDESQTVLWERTYGVPENSEAFGGFAPTQDGGFVLAGDGHWGHWPMAMRVDANGDTLWDREYPFTDFGMAEAIVQTPDGGFAMTGFAATDIGVQVLFAKLDSAGNLVQQRSFGDSGPNTESEGNDIVSVSGGGFLIAGQTNAYSGNVWDMMVLRLNENGDSLWARVIQCGIFNIGMRCRELVDGSYILESKCLSEGTYSLSLTHLSPSGETMWQQQYPVGDWFAHAGLDTDTSGRYLMCAEQLFDTALVMLTVPDTTLSAPSPPSIPNSTALTIQAYPNPFNAQATLTLYLPKAGRVEVGMYDVLGRAVRTIADEVMAAGERRMVVNGEGLSSGIYFVRVKAGEERRVRKMVMMK